MELKYKLGLSIWFLILFSLVSLAVTQKIFVNTDYNQNNLDNISNLTVNDNYFGPISAAAFKLGNYSTEYASTGWNLDNHSAAGVSVGFDNENFTNQLAINLSARDILLDMIGNPDGDVSFNFGNRMIDFIFSAPAGDGFDIIATGGFQGDLLHIEQRTGNPGVLELLHLEANDPDVEAIHINITGTTAVMIDSGWVNFSSWNGSAALIDDYNLDSNTGWTNMSNYPVPCTDGSYITALDDSVTCVVADTSAADDWNLVNSTAQGYITSIPDIYVFDGGDNLTGDYNHTSGEVFMAPFNKTCYGWSCEGAIYYNGSSLVIKVT